MPKTATCPFCGSVKVDSINKKVGICLELDCAKEFPKSKKEQAKLMSSFVKTNQRWRDGYQMSMSAQESRMK